MNSDTVQDAAEGEQRPYLKLPLPVPDRDLFRYGASADILWLLAREPAESFTHRELARRTEYSLNAINQAIDVLERVGWVTVDRTGAHNEVGIAPESLVKPDDPVLQVPQPEFHEPVRALLDRIREELEHVEGIVLFGSVARGKADRSSDVDLFVLVSENQPANQRRAHDIEDEFGDREFNEQRYVPHIIVESPTSITLSDEKYRRIFLDGIVLYETERLNRMKHSVLSMPPTTGQSSEGNDGAR